MDATRKEKDHWMDGRNSGCNGRNRSGRIVDGYRRIAMGIRRYQ
jgi:hypothetical protein